MLIRDRELSGVFVAFFVRRFSEPIQYLDDIRGRAAKHLYNLDNRSKRNDEYVHNMKQRMPVMLKETMKWLGWTILIN
jgi:hypothetical protein